MTKVKISMNDLGGLFGVKAPFTDSDFLKVPKDLRLEIVLDFFKEKCYNPGSCFEKRKGEFKSNLWAMYHSVPQFYSNKIFFYEAKEQVSGNSCSSREGWERWMNKKNIVENVIHGNHYTVLQLPHVNELYVRIYYNILQSEYSKNLVE